MTTQNKSQKAPRVDYTKCGARLLNRKKLPQDIQTSNILVGFSTTQDYHTGNCLVTITEYIQSQGFKKCKFLPAGILERYNLAIEEDSTPEEMRGKAREKYFEWRRVNRRVFKTKKIKGNAPKKIENHDPKKIKENDLYTWEDILTKPEFNYSEERKQIDAEYNKKGSFYEGVKIDAKDYLNRKKNHSKYPERYDSDKALDYAIQYKLEELTVFKILAIKEHFDYFAYPGKCPKAVKALFTEILNPKTLPSSSQSDSSETSDLSEVSDISELSNQSSNSDQSPESTQSDKKLFKWFGIDLYNKEPENQNSNPTVKDNPPSNLNLPAKPVENKNPTPIPQATNPFGLFTHKAKIEVDPDIFKNILLFAVMNRIEHGSPEQLLQIAEVMKLDTPNPENNFIFPRINI